MYNTQSFDLIEQQNDCDCQNAIIAIANNAQRGSVRWFVGRFGVCQLRDIL